jgi:hypothetical protein
MTTTPPVTFRIEDSPKHCTYGGQVSAHIYLAGKELLRYEALTKEIAQEYLDHLEYWAPRLNDRKVWELLVFSDSGFQTLYLDGNDEPQCVMSHVHLKDEGKDLHLLTEKVVRARNLAARYHQWYWRRGWLKTKNTVKLQAILEVLNTILREPGVSAADQTIDELCPLYTVEKGVSHFLHTNPKD